MTTDTPPPGSIHAVSDIHRSDPASHLPRTHFHTNSTHTTMRWHHQNLCDNPDGTAGPLWRNGRAWLRRGDRWGASLLRVEWSVSGHSGLAFEVTRSGSDSDDDHAWKIHVALWFAAFWLSLGSRRRMRSASSRWGFYLTREEWYLHVSLGDDEWGESGRSKGWFLPDVLFGRAKHNAHVYHTEDALIPMPEGAYPATVKLERRTWKRPRWPFAKVVYGASVDIPGGIAVPGKGENSWDCGDDAIHGLSTPARTVEEAVSAVVKSAMRTRRRYGGMNWEPSVPEGAA